MISLRNIEFYSTPDNEVMIKPLDEPVHLLSETGKENRDFITSFISYLTTFYTEAWKALSDVYSRKEPNRINYEYWIVSRFILCNFSEYDTNTIDIDAMGRFNFEEVKCPIRRECPLHNICCKPNFNTTLTFREMNILRLIVERNTVEEIAPKLHISPHTVSSHIRNIHIKTSTRNIADLVNYWFTNNLH